MTTKILPDFSPENDGILENAKQLKFLIDEIIAAKNEVIEAKRQAEAAWDTASEAKRLADRATDIAERAKNLALEAGQKANFAERQVREIWRLIARSLPTGKCE